MLTIDWRKPRTSLAPAGDVFEEVSHSKETPTRTSSFLLVLFFITILLPFTLEIGGLKMSPNRLYLIIFSIPFAVKVLQGQSGRFTGTDLCFVLFGVWSMLALFTVHGVERLPYAAITMVELTGGYFVGRVLIRNRRDYDSVVWFVLIAMICLLPFTLVEVVTGKMILPDLFRSLFEAPSRGNSAYGRLGLERVYSVFEHPILFGLFCSSALAHVFYLFSGRPFRASLAALFTLAMAFTSLSSAPLLACMLQIILLLWYWIVGGRWILLIILSVVMYVTLDAASNRTPITIMIETLTFNSGTGWTRIAINIYGWQSVWNHPVFGLGLNDWSRPEWLTSSVDNFWLLAAMRYGLPALIFVILGFLFHLVFLSRAQIENPDIQRCRTAHGIVLVGICFTLITVHIWGTTSVFVMFLVGAGAWMYTADTGGAVAVNETKSKRTPVLKFTRFAREANRP